MAGAVALAAYSGAVCLLLQRRHWQANVAALFSITVWFVVAFGIGRGAISALREVHCYEFAVRFALGGAMTVMAGAIATRFGPAVGGLFLAFPAIFPASVTLVEKHVRQQKEDKGLFGVFPKRRLAVQQPRNDQNQRARWITMTKNMVGGDRLSRHGVRRC